MDAYRCGFKASPRARYALIDVRDLYNGFLALLRRGFVWIERRKEVRPSKVFRRWGRLRSCLFGVVFRVRLVFCRLSSERWRIHVPRPTRRVFGSTRVLVLRAYHGAVQRQNRCCRQGVEMLFFCTTYGLGYVAIVESKRAGRRVGYDILRLLPNDFLDEGLYRA